MNLHIPMAGAGQKLKILTLVSRVIGLDMEYFLKNGMTVAIRYGIVSLSGLILSIGFARLGSKELLGQYQAVLALLALLSIFSLPGLNLAALKAVTEGNRGAILRAVKYSFWSSLLGLPFLIGYAAWLIMSQGNAPLGIAIIVAGVFFPFLYAPNTWYVFYEGRSSFAPVSRRMISVSLLTTGGILGVLYFQGGVLPVLLIYFGIATFANWFFFFQVRKEISKEGSGSGQLDTRYGLSVSCQKFVFSLAENLPVLAISYIFGFEALAIFQIAYFFMNAVAGFLSGLSATYLPLLFRYQTFNYGKIILQNLVIGLGLFLVFRILLVLFFIPLYGTGYQESLIIAETLSFLIIFYPLKTFLINFLTAQKKNFLIVSTFLVANGMSLGIFYLLKNISLAAGVSGYLYTLNIGLLLPFLWIYFSRASKKTDSNFSPMRSGRNF